MNIVLAAILQELEAAIAVNDRRATFIHVLYSDSTITLIPLPCLGNGAEAAAVPQGTDARAPEKPPDGRRRTAVLTVLETAEKPLKGAALAGRAGLRYDSHFREIMGDLVREEKVIHAPRGGYWLKGRPFPDRA